MNLLADEGVDRPIVESLRQNSHDVIYIAEVDPSISDHDVFDRANTLRAILLTADKDFGEIVFKERRLLSGGVILIRLAGLSAEKKAEIVVETIQNYDARLAGCFTVLSPGRVRVISNKS